MNNNYKIIRTIFENVFQRVLECKDNDTGHIFYSNIITSRKVINLINLEELRKIPSNILECYNTDDRIYIYTKPLKTEHKCIKEIASSNLTLKSQFKLSENVVDLAQNIFNMTDVVQQKILDMDKLYVDQNNNVIVDCNLIFEQEYDIADNETLKRLGNVIHLIFSGVEIIDYNISDSIPPDILKIIVRCLTKEYIFPNDVISEMKGSPIYSMIFGIEYIKEKENISIENKLEDNTEQIEIKQAEIKQAEIKQAEIKQTEILKDTYEEIDVDDEYGAPIFDIYVNDNNPPKYNNPSKSSKKAGKLFTKKDIIRASISIFIVVFVLLAGNKLIKKIKTDEPVNSGNVQNGNENENSEKTPKSEDDLSGEVAPDTEILDSTEVHFNDQLLNNVGYTGNKADIDSNIYVEGKNSLVVANEGEEKAKALFAVIDFKDEKFNYMLKKQIGISAKMKSQNDVQAQIVLEAYKDGALTSNFHSLAKIYNDMWSQFTVPINVTDADSLNIYIEYEGANKVWIDSIYIDVVK